MHTLKRLIAFLMNTANGLIRKKDNRVLFIDEHTRLDNTWALMLAMAARGGREIVYYSKEPPLLPLPDGVRHIRRRAAAYRAFFTSRLVFWAYGPLRLFLRPAKGQTVVNLWHGSPLKDITMFAHGGQFAWKDSFSYVLAGSGFFAPVMQKTFGCAPEQVIIAPAPRNNALFALPPSPNTVVWFPTFRKSASLSREDSAAAFPLLRSESDYGELCAFCGANGISLIIKPHPAAAAVPFLRSRGAVTVVYNEDLRAEGMTPYTLLAKSAALLTDYSSVFFDYLLLGRPIGFIIDDIDSYREKRGFVAADPLELMPGPKITSMGELFAFLRDVASGQDSYADERARVRALANAYVGPHSAETALDIIERSEITEKGNHIRDV
jgi:CDP-glycerol glycerophosphotransferase (TagB/SpsB family)